MRPENLNYSKIRIAIIRLFLIFMDVSYNFYLRVVGYAVVKRLTMVMVLLRLTAHSVLYDLRFRHSWKLLSCTPMALSAQK